MKKTVFALMITGAFAMAFGQTTTFTGSGMIETAEYSINYIAPVNVYLPIGTERIAWITVESADNTKVELNLTYYDAEGGGNTETYFVTGTAPIGVTTAIQVQTDATDITLTVTILHRTVVAPVRTPKK